MPLPYQLYIVTIIGLGVPALTLILFDGKINRKRGG